MSETSFTPDADLDRWVAFRDPVAFEQYLNRHRDLIYGIAGKGAETWEDAEDIAQEAMIRLAKLPAGFEQRFDPRMLVAYHTRLARMRYWQTRARHRRRDDDIRSAAAAKALRSPARTPDEMAAEREYERRYAEWVGRIRAAVPNLAEKYGSVFDLRFFRDKSTAETADLLGITKLLVATRFLRARKMLAARVGPPPTPE